MKSPESPVAERLRIERKRLGLSQDDLARACGCSRATIAAYEAGRTSPDLNYLADAASLGIDFQFILTGRRLQDIASDVLDWNVVIKLLLGIRAFAQEQSLAISVDKEIEILRVLYPHALHDANFEREDLSRVCRLALAA